ncbi:MAG: cytochrome ubiquinol oxidase subunit I, partial [Nitrospirae bacterium]|nr:cytochrome ubiquinol oxidase subunit I [Nitrospirota bacterium]
MKLLKAISKGKTLWAMVGLSILIVPLLLSFLLFSLSGPAQAQEAEAPKMGKDIYYKTEGPISGIAAPKLQAGDYPVYKAAYPISESRIVVWTIAQQHLYFGSFVLAVPIFVMIIEIVGMMSKDPVVAKRYDELGYDFIRISLTAYSVTAILGGLLIFTFITLYPDFFRYLASLFRPYMHIYALLFLAESGTLYLYYYGWHKMDQGFLKWIHASMGVLLNV